MLKRNDFQSLMVTSHFYNKMIKKSKGIMWLCLRLVRIICWLRREWTIILICWWVRGILRCIECPLWRISCWLRRVWCLVGLALGAWKVCVAWLGWWYSWRSRVENPSVGVSGTWVAWCSSLVLWGVCRFVSGIRNHSSHRHACVIDVHIAESHRRLRTLASLLF